MRLLIADIFDAFSENTFFAWWNSFPYSPLPSFFSLCICYRIFSCPINHVTIPFTSLPSLTALGGGTSFLVPGTPLVLGSDASSGACSSANVSLGVSLAVSAGTSSEEDTPFSKEMSRITNRILMKSLIQCLWSCNFASHLKNHIIS